MTWVEWWKSSGGMCCVDLVWIGCLTVCLHFDTTRSNIQIFLLLFHNSFCQYDVSPNSIASSARCPLCLSSQIDGLVTGRMKQWWTGVLITQWKSKAFQNNLYNPNPKIVETLWKITKNSMEWFANLFQPKFSLIQYKDI